MKRKNICIWLMSVAVGMGLLAGCSGKTQEAPSKEDSSVVDVVEESVAETTSVAETEEAVLESSEQESSEESLTQESEESLPISEETGESSQASTVSGEVRQKYADILTKILTDRELPSKEVLYTNEYVTEDSFEFAVGDYDGDGNEELLFSYGGTCMADMVLYVWGYDPQSDLLTEELCEFPAVSFYDSGCAKAEASHNHGTGPDYWPYTLYFYNAELNSYSVEADVDAWQKEYYPTSYDNEPFPDDADADGDGVVFIVSSKEYETVDYLDNADYDAWCEENITGSEIIPEWKTITEDAILEMQN